MLRHMPQLTSLQCRSTVAGSLAMAVALHGVQLADTADVDLARLETQTVRAIWGPTRPGRAKEVAFSLLTPGHRTSPTMCTKNERLVWMAQLARVPGAAQVLMQAIWECGDAPPLHRPAGRAVRTPRALRWAPMGVWWRWRVPGQGEPLDLVAGDWALLRHRIRESLLRAALLRLEARRPQTFGGLAGTIDRRACRTGLARFRGETELSILQDLLTGATWTASRAGKRRMRPTLACPYLAAQVTEDEWHILWHCACWSAERDTWLPWLQEATGNLPALSTVVDNWPPCLQHACLVPSWATEGVDPEQMDESVYGLFGLALSVLMARMRAEQAASDRGHVGLLFPDMPRPGGGRTNLWQELVGPLPWPDRGPQLRLAPGLPRGWNWDRRLAADLVSWASVLRWREKEVSYKELAMDFEATSGRALPARPEHALRMTVLPLQERAPVLWQAARALLPHLLVGRLLPAEESPRCHSLIALGGRTCLGLKGRPYFAARGEMVRMLEGLAAHCVT